MKKLALILILICLPLLSGCGYAICRSFLNTAEQCTQDCTWEYIDAQGQRIPDPLGRPGEYKVKKTCTYNLRKVLIP